MTKKTLAMSIAFLLIITLTACGTAKELLNQAPPATLSPNETIGATENISATDSYKIFAQGLDYAENEDWLKAYACYLTVDEYR